MLYQSFTLSSGIGKAIYTCDLGEDVGRGFTENRGAN